MKKRLLCLLLAVVLILPLLVQAAPNAEAAKQEKTRAIGIVFDNSGSMYGSTNSSWCRATYAMEVFAAMLNEGDTLQVYPMWPITLGNAPGAPEVSIPLEIHSPSEASTIRQIYSPDTGGTPFSSVTQAYEGLKKVSADEKYLIVITDGAFDEGFAFAQEGLTEYSKDMNVMFLGFSGAQLPTVTDPTRQYYVQANSSSEVLSKLTDMCNRIFGRDALTVSGDQITFDVSMSKIIVFVQGEDVSGVKLSSGSPKSQQEVKYSELGCGDYSFLVDESLQGMIATYDGMDAGTYSVSYTGDATSINVYYEPDVDLRIRLIGEGGAEVDPAGELYSGNYTLEYYVVDKYGNPTESDLLGNVSYDISYTVNGQTETIQSATGGSVELVLEAGATLDGTFKVTYLNDYTITKDSAALGWPNGGLQIGTRPAGSLTMQVSGGANVYKLSELEEQAVYEVTLYYEGEPVSGSALDQANVTAAITDGNALPEVEKNENGFTVSLKYNQDATNTQCGIQSIAFNAEFVNEDGQTAVAVPTQLPFEIQDDSQGLVAELDFEQKYYVISQIDEGKPFRVILSSEGAPLTPEQFATTTVRVDVEGIACDVQPDEANSCYIVTLKGGDIAAGKHEVKCTAEGFDVLGRPISSEATDSIECQAYPAWVRTVFWIGIILLIMLLIWLFMNAKVLPKRIAMNNGAMFNVDGEMIPGNVICNYAGGGKKRGTLKIQSPPYMTNPLAKCGFILELEAASPRRVKSRSRSVRVKAVKALNPATTSSIMIGGFQMARDPITDKLVRVGTNPDAPVNFTIGNNISTVVAAEIQSMEDSGSVSCSLNGPLTFY